METILCSLDLIISVVFAIAIAFVVDVIVDTTSIALTFYITEVAFQLFVVTFLFHYSTRPLSAEPFYHKIVLLQIKLLQLRLHRRAVLKLSG